MHFVSRLAAAVLPLLILGCTTQRPAERSKALAARASSPRSAAIDLGTADFEDRVVQAFPDEGGSSNEWYLDMGSPRILILFNRKISGDDEIWRSDSRVKQRLATGSTQGSGANATRETDRIEATTEVERRIDAPPHVLSPQAEIELRTAFLRSFLQARCTLVDAGVIERVAQARASEKGGQEAMRSELDIGIDAFLEEADWLIQVSSVPSGQARMPIILFGEIIDLKSRRLVAQASSIEIPEPLRLPGTSGGSAPPPISLAEQADWLSQTLIYRLAPEQ